MEDSDDDIQTTLASILTRAEEVQLHNSVVLNASGPITYLNFSASEQSRNAEAHNRRNLAYSMLENLLSVITNPFKLSTPTIPAPSLQPEAPAMALGSLSLDSLLEDVGYFNDSDGDFSDSYDSMCVDMTQSDQLEFYLSGAVSRSPTGCETYIEKLFPLKHGYPLWLPQPSRHLPDEYVRKGVSLGDVGRITPDGSFDFLFNIWTHARDPIHPNNLPDSFNIMSPPTLQASSLDLFQARDILSNYDSGIERRLDSATFDATYIVKSEDIGAVLSMPLGAIQEDCENDMQQLKKFIVCNAESWYRYAKTIRGRNLDRHSLYIITGSVKSRSWGIVTYETSVLNRKSTLVIGKTPHKESPAYEWKFSLDASKARTGPVPGRTTDVESRLPDSESQCLFLRGFKISLSEDAWDAVVNDPDPVINEARKQAADSDKSHGSRGNKLKSRSNEDTSSKNVFSSNLGRTNAVDITGLESSKQNLFHPLNALNDMLLSQVSGSRVAVTHDKDWWSVVDCYSEGMGEDTYSVDKFLDILQNQFCIGYYNKIKVCTLEPRGSKAIEALELQVPMHPNNKQTALFLEARTTLATFLTSGAVYNLDSLGDTTTHLILNFMQMIMDNNINTNFQDSKHFKNLLLGWIEYLSSKAAFRPMSYFLLDIKGTSTIKINMNTFKVYFKGQILALKYMQGDRKVTYGKDVIQRGFNHPNLLPFYGIYSHKIHIQTEYFVSPWMSNGNINTYLQQKSDVNRQHLVLDIAQGLRYLHKNNLLHGNLKGTNVLLSDNGVACLCDFSSTSSPWGTWRWIAPEDSKYRLLENKSATLESDIYSFACVCYEVFTGKMPFYNVQNEGDVYEKIKSGGRPKKPQRNSISYTDWGLTDWMWLLMEECWNQNPARRPLANELVKRLSSRKEFTVGDNRDKNWGDLSGEAFRFRVGPSSPMSYEDIRRAMSVLKSL